MKIQYPAGLNDQEQFERIITCLNNIDADNLVATITLTSLSVNNIYLPANGEIYIGLESTNGSWRIKREGNNLVQQRRESGVWVTKVAATP